VTRFSSPSDDEERRPKRAIRARDVRAADLQANRRKSSTAELIIRSRFVGFDEDGGCQASIAASAS
jgi:hypothetical protein